MIAEPWLHRDDHGTDPAKPPRIDAHDHARDRLWLQCFLLSELCQAVIGEIFKVQSKDDQVIMLGHAFWSDENPNDRTIWTAVIEENLVKEWRVYYNTPEIRNKFGIE